MQFSVTRLALVLAFCVAAVSGKAQEPVRDMKLLAPNVGWASTQHQVFWTTDNGAHWKDITPKAPHMNEEMLAVFFVNQTIGWAAMSWDGTVRRPGEEDRVFRSVQIVSTTDAGATWDVAFHEDNTDVGGGYLDFADAQHGWFLEATHSRFQEDAGVLRRTSDGGKTWTATKSLPLGNASKYGMAGEIHFINAKDGWLNDVKSGEGLYTTHDGGDTWAATVLPVVPGTTLGDGAQFSLPNFTNDGQGFLCVHASKTLVYSSMDRGLHWKPGLVLSEDGGAVMIDRGTIFEALVSARLDTLTFSQRDLLQPNAPRSQSDARLDFFPRPNRYPEALSAADSNSIWLRVGSLLSTTDGGRTWGDITPGGLRHGSVPKPPTAKSFAEASDTINEPSPMPSTSTPAFSHLGFDSYKVPCPPQPTTCNVTNSLGVMQSWWASSPFYVDGFYLNGALNRVNDSNVTSAWIQGAKSQGWALIPVWIGVQSKCACHTVQGQCVQYSSLFSSNPTSDGTQEADAAIAAANLVGITSGIIYKDIENPYAISGCNDDPAVQAYVNGWDTEMHAKGWQAGVYGNPTAAKTDFGAKGIVQPDDVWVPKTVTNSLASPYATIWGLAPLCDYYTIKGCTTLWPNHQRSRQFLTDQAGFKFAGTPVQIDVDLVDSQILGSAGSKTYNFTYSNITPGTGGQFYIFPSALSDKNNANGSFITGNSPVQLGQLLAYDGGPYPGSSSYSGGA